MKNLISKQESKGRRMERINWFWGRIGMKNEYNSEENAIKSVYFQEKWSENIRLKQPDYEWNIMTGIVLGLVI
jgi:hypothetical protein